MGPPVEVPDGVEVPVLLGGEIDPVPEAVPPEPEPEPEPAVGTETADEAMPAFPETWVDPTLLLLAEDETGVLTGAALLDCGAEIATGAVFVIAGA